MELGFQLPASNYNLLMWMLSILWFI